MARSEPDEVSAPGEMRVFWFLLLTMVVVVTAVTLAVVGGGGSAVLRDVPPERFIDPLPATRPVGRADVEALRLPMAPRGYRMADVDEALSRLGAELAERDARIAELESSLAGAQAAALTKSTDLFEQPGDRPAGPGDQQTGGPGRTEEDGR
ncbi:DivIVA domain-containing protein [Streptomyces sp. NPDC048142]|uniref:DivIVA domain-containing protein n=1 Tax=Streptomyces sp. NPDC048142 TaxID=3365501 RepID=UPI0037203347